MTSTVSFKDRIKQSYSVFKWDLKSCSGTMVVYAILAIVAIILSLTVCLVSANNGMFSVLKSDNYDLLLDAIQSFQMSSASIIFMLTMIFTVIFTVKVYSYLHNKRKADLYGALPISRISLLISKSASALLFSVVPAMFFIGIVAIISVCFGQPLVNEVTGLYKNFIIGSLASISAYGLVAVCCGTTANSVVMFLAVCISYPISAMFIKGVVFGMFCGTYSDVFEKSFIMSALNPLAAYDGRNTIYWLIFSAVCIAASLYLVKNRKAERAQSAFAYYLPAHIVKVLVAFIFGMLTGVVFGSLNVFGMAYWGFVFGFLLGSVPAYIIAHLIFYKGFSSLAKSSIVLSVLVFVVCFSMGFISYDVFGYNNYLPSADEVQSGGYISYGTFIPESSGIREYVKNSREDYSDKADIDEIIHAHKTTLGNLEFGQAEKFGRVFEKMTEDSLSAFGVNDYYGVSYKLKDGKKITRVYSRMDFDGEYVVPSFVQKEKYLKKYSAVMTAQRKDISDFAVFAEYEKYCGLFKNINGRDAALRIMEAYKKDAAADEKTAKYTLNPAFCFNGYDDEGEADSIESYKQFVPDAVCLIGIDLNDYYVAEHYYSSYYNPYEYSATYIVPASYKNTISVLKDLGILTDDLKINEKSDYFLKRQVYPMTD